MNIPLLAANFLLLLAFVVHTVAGDRELKILEPNAEPGEKFQRTEKWIMARCGWHWVSFDLLMATLGLGLINFTNRLENEKTWLQILGIYFLGYSIVWALTIAISKQFPKNYLKLGQWMLLLLIGLLICFGID
jgi:hypothetical protein